MTARWHFWIDRGGTFTDLVARATDGRTKVHKVLSEHPSGEDAVLRGLRALLDLPAGAPLPAERIAGVQMGTTVATNALLERTGTPTVFVTTAGHADVLRIGTQQRPDLFARHIVRPEPLYQQVATVRERMGADGTVVQPLDEAQAWAALEAAYADGCRACAIALLHGYRYPAHEEQVAALARAVGFAHVSTSHATDPLQRLVPRGHTTVVDAYVAPVLRQYVDRVQDALGDGPLQLMQSNGGLASAPQVRGKDTLLSGPAGGLVGAVRACAEAGYDRLVSFDMGGTSTDVAHYAGTLERRDTAEVAGVPVRTPVLDIHTVAAGGGSIVRVDQGRYRVGPDSAGAQPGPACYGQGGPLTITDCHLQLGRLQPDFFPSVFGPAGDAPLDAPVVQDRFDALADEAGDGRTPEAMAEGFLTIAVEKMAQAIRTISLERGHDIDGYTLCCFGGAGGQHACRMAEALGLDRVLVHPYAGVLSAYGIGVADERIVRREAIDALLAEAEAALSDRLDALAQQARRTLGAEADALQVYPRVSLRYRGTDTALPVAADTAAAMREAFATAYQQRFGFAGPDRPLVAEAIEVEVVRPATVPENEPLAQPRHGPPAPEATVSVYSHSAWHAAPLFERATLQPEDRLSGPAIIAESTGTTVLEPGWQATVNAHGHLLLTPASDASPSSTRSATEAPEADTPDPVRLTLFNHRFRAIAERMGTTLQQTATSVNIKERLDFSCAIFDGAGQLVANAPHIPVHLGSMSASVQHIIDTVGNRLAPGDAYALNNPYRGGTHLPDVTVVSPVFLSDQDAADAPTFFVASRGHHADIGGITPGSMPPTSQHIDEEGVLIDSLQLVNRETFQEEDWRDVLNSGAHPARNPDQNTADVQAQLAANAHGVQGLAAMVATYGRATVTAYMQHLQDHAAASVRQAIVALRDGSFATRLDTGEAIRVAVTVDPEARSARLDFSDTAAQVATNFNAPAAITQAAVLYVFRTLVDEDLPLNAGCLAPLEIIVPEGSLLNPTYPAAVVAGNVETSQLVTDALFGALGVLAGSQGTMNNLTFGNSQHQYYETICGGSGAGPDHPGADAVQVHMTNSRLTDAEVLEAQYPVRVMHFGIRTSSGGAGRQPGGNGVVRQLQFLEPMTAAILSSRRVEAPFGLDGGAPGQCGRNTLHRADGASETLGGTAVVNVQPGDTLIIETPGGGGYGAA